MEDIGYGMYIVMNQINNYLRSALKEYVMLIKQYNKILKMK